MSYNIFLDDLRNPEDFIPSIDWVLCKNDIEFKSTILERGVPNIISFDHDLGEDSLDGYELIKWLAENDIIVKNIIIHTDNSVGGENIKGYAEFWHKHLIRNGIIEQHDSQIIREFAMNLLKNNKNG